MSIKACIDEPVAHALSYRHSVTVSGFAFCTSAKRTIKMISIRAGSRTVGETATFFDRPDVAASFPKAGAGHSGFEVLCDLDPEPSAKTLAIDVIATLSDGEERPIGRVPLRLTSTDYRNVDYGNLIDPGSGRQWTREKIYGSGPPSPIASSACLALLTRFVKPRDRVLDVGCGVGAYAEELIRHGVEWTGCESSAALCTAVVARGLRCPQVKGEELPFEDASFDRSICIEVLEHVAEPGRFVAEIARVTATGAYFSVPNAELIPLMRPLHAVPWHLLELDHKNFFSRFSLKKTLAEVFAHVEVLPYAPLPIKSAEGLPLPCHLFAIASHATPQPNTEAARNLGIASTRNADGSRVVNGSGPVLTSPIEVNP